MGKKKEGRLAEVLRAFVRREVPDFTGLRERTVPFGEARVWSVHRGDEVVAWLKRHRNAGKAERERRAYEDWLPHVGWGSARFLGVCPDDPRSLLTAHVEGSPGDDDALSIPDDVLFREIGRFCAALHRVPAADTDPVPLVEALQERQDAWCARAEGVVDDDLLRDARELFAAPLGVELTRVPCHRDLHLRNVIVDSTQGFRITVIDFGQSRLDVWLSDVVKLLDLQQASPAAWRGFFDGYGRRLTPRELDLFRQLRAMHGLATWVWGWEHEDRGAVRQGRRILEAAVEDPNS